MNDLIRTLHRSVVPLACAGVVASLAPGCDLDQNVSNAEFRAAVDEVVLTGEAASLQDGVIEITTNFTLADGAAAVAEEVRTFVQSQMPCSTVDSTEPGTLVIDFGDLGDQCTYNGRTFAGVVTVSFEIDQDAVLVTHDYEEFTNGSVTMNGQALVTWADQSRRVETDFEFTGRGRTVTVDSDRTQTLLGGLGDGIEVDGERNWTGQRGTWHLDIDQVQMRGIDPVPQSGTYTLTNPEDKELSLSFERIDENTIEVVVAAGLRSRTFHVTSAGSVGDMSE